MTLKLTAVQIAEKQRQFNKISSISGKTNG